MNTVEKTQRLSIRVTEKEKKMIQKKAEKLKTTISALVINSVEKQITVNLNTSDYRDLVIQFRRIGNNVNSLIREIRFSNYIDDSQVKEIDYQLKSLERLLKNEKVKIDSTKIEMEKMTARQLRELLENQNKRVPNYLIYENIEEHIVSQLRSFIDLTIQSNLDETYPPYIEYFLKNFQIHTYDYDTIVDFSNVLDEKIYAINQKLIARNSQLEEEDFLTILNVLDDYRKVRED
ncbi:hypothetical protein N2D39_12310 [Enterococcus faecalis]|uniref:Plasmid mobilization relaxosome protein MobC n=2 Tax=Enterococcus faecalis TaxID=1351 RepID=A0A1S5UWB2_ENTFL|nr:MULTISPECIES: hypothetical protein [Enterococcus]AQM74945.1 hypothetical protein [Enterococcus faecalis]MBB6710041.1 hypothetical protein [Enterococcus faecalis]MBV6973924.1 hypothetical protein [Enterococcus hirae]MCD4893739.1 hypothetical protein [Enterococcus faecalis]MCD4897068.1 hypothetical protein [Enterococcus faecalis]